MEKSILRKIIMLSKYFVCAFLFQLFCTCVLFASPGKAQLKSLDDITVTVNFQESALNKVIPELERQSGLLFTYNKSKVPVDKLRVNVSMTKAPLTDVLHEISKQTNLKFVQLDDNIHITRGPKVEKSKEEALPPVVVEITGQVLDPTGLALPGVTVRIKNTTRGTTTDLDGNYTINVNEGETLVFSFIGFVEKEITVTNQTVINVILEENLQSLEEVIVVGYAEQKKETIVGAVAQTSGEVLKRTGGISNVGSALTGNLPGVITTASTGVPGGESPQIVIRGQNSWNGNSPLILVDGVERPEFFNTMDIASVESISVLKDASATAVFGSRGANGVIIVTTKRGREGKAQITANVNSTMKVVSKLPGKFDAYDAIGVRNRAIENELTANPAGWADYVPYAVQDKYRNPLDWQEAERYPNVDWQETLFKDYAMAYNANVGIRGGTKFTQYFASIDFQNEGDLFRNFDNNRGYEPGYNYNRLNFRSNLDFELTSSTKLQVNLGGSYGVRKTPWGGGDSNSFWSAAYANPPDAFMPVYADGAWGVYTPDDVAAQNSVRILAVSGIQYLTTTQLSTNFVLNQDLSMILKGLDFRGTLAIDNSFTENNRGVNDLYNTPFQKWIDPETGLHLYDDIVDANSRFDFREAVTWGTANGNVQGAQRRLYYQFQLNYAGSVAEDHHYNLMGLMSRQQDATGNMIPAYREDWVFRANYDYKNKYLIDYSGAYNGSEKFAPEYRFAFFSSGGIGWVISEEGFMKSLSFLDFLKIRASYGEVGDDNIGGRFLFMDQWNYGNSSQLGIVGEGGEYSPYTWYSQTAVGNPQVTWETVYKTNIGVEFDMFNGMINGNFEYFKDDRKDILMSGDRSIPSYYGTTAPAANLGRVITNGFEFTIGASHTFENEIRVWGDFTMTHAENEVIERDDPELQLAYQKDQGYQLGQYRTHISNGYYSSWDEVYGSTPHNSNDQFKLPGGLQILDFNGDGIIDSFDGAPYGFSSVPENTFSTNLGVEWKGLSLYVQFYGVNNVTRDVPLSSLNNRLNRVYEEGTYWSEDNTNPDSPMPRWGALMPGYTNGQRYLYDGSYLRLKNAEIAYLFNGNWVRNLGVETFRIYLNGNNLLLWTDMPDDRESNFSSAGWAGAYPTVRRINLGLNVSF
ncbi:TonB-dependent receptor [Algoriphagus halophytocola]|uniref:TonB-dependent receptor n=1 Tax=Algoriphagus halophytocola TaxID=2991499 RepID=A0ABY6MI26_9BACT|nr:MULTISPECIES: TonB-dependent receptor [unclassified Algoriphagus]UZD22858.1 TonB-dependent receptor [Algoriphagus sp. TR-M5]WBL44125.1 TonB-dependent receptor [Algoriphagus sp. TR-M9]